MYKLDGPSVKANNEAEKTLRRAGDKIFDEVKADLNAMSKPLLHSSYVEVDERMLFRIADGLLKDGKENWGRVVSIFVFGAVLARNNKHHRKQVDSIIQLVGDCVGSRKRKWIKKNGGWDNFVRFFDYGASDKSKVWMGLVVAVISLASLVVLR